MYDALSLSSDDRRRRPALPAANVHEPVRSGRSLPGPRAGRERGRASPFESRPRPSRTPGSSALELELPGTSEVIWASAEPRFHSVGAQTHFSGLHFLAMARKHERLIRDYVRERRERWLRLFTPAPDLRQPLRLPLLVARGPDFQSPRTALDVAMVRRRGPVFLGARSPGGRRPATARGAIFLVCGVWRWSWPCSSRSPPRRPPARTGRSTAPIRPRCSNAPSARCSNAPTTTMSRGGWSSWPGATAGRACANGFARAPSARRPNGGHAAYAPLAAYAHLLAALGDREGGGRGVRPGAAGRAQSVPALAGRPARSPHAGDDAAALAAYDDALKLERRAPARRRLIDAALAILARSAATPRQGRARRRRIALLRELARVDPERDEIAAAPGRRAGTRGHAPPPPPRSWRRGCARDTRREARPRAAGRAPAHRERRSGRRRSGPPRRSPR